MILTFFLALGQALGLVRTTVVARLLGTEVQGEAVIIGMITGFFASVFTLNAAWQLVQSPRHEDDEFLNSLHASTIARGVGATLLIAVAATIVLSIAGYEELIAPMLLASMVPLLEGFIHLDAWRLIRAKRYRRVALIEISGPLFSIVAAVMALGLTRTVWVVPIVALGSSIGRVITSHVLAKARWRPYLRRDDIREIVRFSLPLIPAGVLYWANIQSDKLVILLSERVNWMEKFDLEALGSYGTIAMLVLLPRGTIVKTMQSIIVPRIASAKNDEADLNNAFRDCWRAISLLAIAIAVVGSSLGQLILDVGLGPQYSSGVAVSPLLIGAMGIQLLRTLSYNSSTGLGTTTTILFGNLIRLVGLGLAILAAYLHLGLAGLAFSVVIAETVAAIATAIWLSRFISGAALKVTASAILAAVATVGIYALRG